MFEVKFDILGHCPLEVAENILGYLDGRDLCASSMVSKRWHELTTNDYLWRTICVKENPQELNYISGIDEQGNFNYKDCYIRASLSSVKWRTNDYWTFKPKKYDFESVFSIGNDAVLGLVREDASMVIYDLNSREKGGEIIQELGPLHEYEHYDNIVRLLDISTEGGGGKWVGFECLLRFGGLYKNIYTFCWNKRTRQLERKGCYHFLESARYGICVLPGPGFSLGRVSFKGFVQDSSIFFDEKFYYIYDGTKITGRINKPRGMDSFDFFSYEDLIFLCTKTRIHGYDSFGKERYSFEVYDLFPYRVISLKCNNNMLFAEMESCVSYVRRIGVGWSWNNPGHRLPFKIEYYFNACLHQKLKQVYYLDEKNERCDIVLKDLETGLNMLVIPFQLDWSLITPDSSGRITLIHNSFALIEFYDEDQQILLDFKNQTCIFDQKGEQFDIETVGNKFLQSSYILKSRREYKVWRVYT